MRLERSSPWLRGARTPGIVLGSGVLSFAFLVGWWIAFADSLDGIGILLSFLFVGSPALGLAWGGYRLERSDIDANRYGRILKWYLGGGAVFLAINLVTIVFYPWNDLAGNVSWAHFSLNAGAVGGFVVGYVEASAIQREVEVTADTVRAEQLEDERALLMYLNDLLRHEVLNSSQIIGGHASLAFQQCDDERLRDRLRTIEHESDDLVGVIEEVRAMLDANRGSETGTVDLTALLEAQLAEYRARFDDATLEATLPDAVAVRGNQGLQWIFSNLLENAIVHNDSERPRVRVTVDTMPESVTVTVADNGPGIPEATRETLFERKSTNHGLGLYLSRILAGRYGGTVALADTGPDGSTFVVTLPRASAAADVPENSERNERSERN
uniref:histidine kinase n=1 Tax=Natrinema zhouii TaxID=1710539 RepID=A0A7D6GMB7_9EURY